MAKRKSDGVGKKAAAKKIIPMEIRVRRMKARKADTHADLIRSTGAMKSKAFDAEEKTVLAEMLRKARNRRMRRGT